MKKYEITEETLVFDGHVLHRIKAVRDFGSVKEGDEGGWIEKEENLFHEGCAWVHGDALAYGNAKVYGDAWVSGNAQVYGNAQVCGNARVYGNAWVSGNARVYGKAWVYGNAQVYGDALVYGNAWVYGNARVCGDALVYEKSHFIYVANIGSRGDTTTFFRTKSGDVAVRCGCFCGDISSFEKAVKRTHHGTMHEKVYMKSIELAKLQLQGRKK